MNETVEILITLFGGLAIFIYGMNLMSDGLQRAAGDRMKKILELLTVNPVVGVIAGALVTAVLQSSSATTVMVIGFASAGLMKLPQAISVIMGANIGTTITAQLIAFKIGDWAWAFVFIGFIMFFFLKKHEQVKNIGQTIFGFGVLFVGINTMGDVMKPLADSQVFIDMMTQVQDVPILGILVGTVMTVVVQSSSATIAVLQNLASTAGPDGVSSILGLSAAIPILFGTNLGTTITAILAAIGQSINAKRAALSHVIFNLSGTLIFIWFIPVITKIVQFISPGGPEVDTIAREIANAHTLFNIANTIIWLPFIFILVKIVTKLIPGGEKYKLPSEPAYLNFGVIHQPTFAIHLATKELSRIGEFTTEMIAKSKQAFLGDDLDAVKRVLEVEDIVNTVQGETVNYLASILSSEVITETQAERVSGLMHVAADLEHIGDSCLNIAEFAEEKTKNHYEFSDTACAEIYECFDQASRMMKDTLSSLETGDALIAKRVMDSELEMNENEKRLRKRHMQRLHNNECSPTFTVIYTDVVHNIEKIGDYCNNIAEAVLEDVHFKNLKLSDEEVEKIEKEE